MTRHSILRDDCSYLSQRRNDSRREVRRCNVVNRKNDGTTEDEGYPVDVVAHLGDQFGKILERFPLLGTGKFFGRERYADSVAVGPTVALE